MKVKNILWLSVFFLVGCEEQTLLTNLNQKQANEAIAILQNHDVDAKKQSFSKQGFSIMVEKSQFQNAVNIVNYYDLPSKARIEIAQMFPEDALVASPLAEKARLYSGIEQRLEQSLKTLRGVITSSLHISYDFLEPAKKNGHEIHITAIVRYDADIDSQLLLADIKRFLKNSVNNIDYENISVVLTPSTKYSYDLVKIEKSGLPWVSIIAGTGLFVVIFGFLLYKFNPKLFQKCISKKTKITSE